MDVFDMKNPKFREIYDQNRNAISEVYSETEEPPFKSS